MRLLLIIVFKIILLVVVFTLYERVFSIKIGEIKNPLINLICNIVYIIGGILIWVLV